MKQKKPTKRKKEITLKSNKSFEELIDDAFRDKSFKKRSTRVTSVVLTTLSVKPKKAKKR
jgi:hypothetical protein